ncbi:uncharacterized protein LOC131048546 [Cryptomeria japonica]|uniref:uncharacterized protein LOC131048546 n=1 Tax=Cryptomeria japonica TaxID=3369 RepID=UPI0027DA2059|nr:uncharacterized protein LOC131048546 [Cryptomeria japonica]
MELYDYELELQSEIVSWKSSRDVDCLMKFIPKPRHVKLGMKGLVWSIEALPLPRMLPGCSSFSFTIMKVKQSRGPLSLSTDSAAPDLPVKFKLLLQIFNVSIKSLSLAEEALDKLYAFSRLHFLAEEDNLWEIIADAEISAAACTTVREVTQEAAEAATAFLLDIKPPRRFSSKAKAKGKGLRSARSRRRGFGQQGWEAVSRPFKAKAAEEGNVLQWCSVKVLERMYPCFEFEVAVQEFLERDDLILQIGLANDRALKVSVLLTKDARTTVVCSQEGVETKTSFGLGYLLPNIIRDYIKAALEKNDSQQNNIVEGVLQHVAGYLASLARVCVICGMHLPLGVPQWSVCSDICKARQQAFMGALPGTKGSEDSWECDENALPRTNSSECNENALPRTNSWERDEMRSIKLATKMHI